MAGAVYIGSVKSFNPEKGWGHIECVETFQIYGKDIFLLKSQLSGTDFVNRGAQVSFRITDNGRGPEAVDVTIIDATAPAPAQTRAYVPQAQAATPTAYTYTGVIKSFNPQSGWGHISCSQTEAIYGKDMFFMKSQLPGGMISKGATVQFSVGEGLKGPEAHSIRQTGGSENMLALPGANTPQMPTSINQWGHNGGGGAMQASQQGHGGGGHGQPYYGTIKSFNDEKGWGHISCPATQQIYQKDMFVMRSALGGAQVRQGDTVQFQVVQGQKGPEATAVKVVGQAGAQATYEGTVKQFLEEKGWGFIACDETRALYNKDIFIHKNVLMGHVPAEGESVQFCVQISAQGRPEACNLVFGATRYNAVRKSPFVNTRPAPF